MQTDAHGGNSTFGGKPARWIFCAQETGLKRMAMAMAMAMAMEKEQDLLRFFFLIRNFGIRLFVRTDVWPPV
jgi:hypothetical protein